MTVKLSIWWIQSNSITFKASAFAKLDVSNSRHECIMPPLWFCPSKNISSLNSVRTDTLLIASSSYTFLDAREGNDRQTVDGNNSIKSKAQAEYLCRRTYNVFHSKRMSKHLRWEWKIKSNSPRSPFIVVVVISKFFAKIFLTSSNSKDRELSTGNIQPNAELIL